MAVEGYCGKKSQFSWGLLFLIGKSSSGELYYTMPFSVALIGKKKLEAEMGCLEREGDKEVLP